MSIDILLKATNKSHYLQISNLESTHRVYILVPSNEFTKQIKFLKRERGFYMRKNKMLLRKTMKKMIVPALSLVLLTGCGGATTNSTTTTTETTQTSDTSSGSDTSTSTQTSDTTTTTASVSVTLPEELFDSEDLASDWDGKADATITLSNSSASVTGNGATANGSTITITEGGTYAVSGTLSDGQIIVETADSADTVRIILNGVDITSSTSAPIYVKESSKVILTLAEGTTNTITDGSSYTLTDTAENEPSAAIFSKSDLVINGTGSLSVKGNYNNGIQSKDDLAIVSGNITVTSIDDAIIGKDSVAIADGTFTLNAGGDGIKSTNSEKTDKGYLVIQSGTFTITSGTDAIQSATLLQTDGGEYTITTGGGSANSSSGSTQENWGQWKQQSTADTSVDTATTDTESSTDDSSTEQSAKAFKSAGDIIINNGTYTIDSSDDSLHATNTITVNNGTFDIASGDDGAHADAELIINDGTLNITKSYEGLESAIITINSGDINVTASDDGLNVAGGADSSSTSGRPGENEFADTGEFHLNINGGNLTVDSQGDGLDSNGSMTITGGTIYVNGPTNDGNGAMDYNGTCDISGGTLIAAGSSGMAQATSTSSTQSSVLMTFTSAQTANTTVTLKDSNGKEIASYTPTKQFQSILISSADIAKDGEYTLSAGSANVTFTVSDTVTYLDESGVTTAPATNGGMGGSKGGGGTRPDGMNGDMPQ